MEFIDHLKKYLSKEEINKLSESLYQEDKKAIYLNTNLISKEEFLELFPKVLPHPVVDNGFIYNKKEYEFGKHILHELGAYYIQEPSAMLVSHFLNPSPNDFVLDLCAAPGGKTIQASLKMENKGLIIANDLSKNRANILLSNIERIGLSNVVVSALDFSKHCDEFKNFFDKIILDAPCSGSGMFRKSLEMKQDWTYEKVLKCAEIQKQLILISYNMLKPGGTLAYSTCSYSYEEDEEIVDYLLQNSDAKLINIPHFEGEYRSKTFKETVHLFPSCFLGEGHYIALIKKPGILKENKFVNTNYERIKESKGKSKEIDYFICNAKLPNHFENFCLRPGLLKETKIGNKILPSHHYSRAPNNLPTINIDKDELIKYISGLTLNKSVKDGFYIVKYKKYNVGLTHVINHIAKNLYPKGLRLNSIITDCL